MKKVRQSVSFRILNLLRAVNTGAHSHRAPRQVQDLICGVARHPNDLMRKFFAQPKAKAEYKSRGEAEMY
jgi:hypothetical protein